MFCQQGAFPSSRACCIAMLGVLELRVEVTGTNLVVQQYVQLLMRNEEASHHRQQGQSTRIVGLEKYR